MISLYKLKAKRLGLNPMISAGFQSGITPKMALSPKTLDLDSFKDSKRL